MILTLLALALQTAPVMGEETDIVMIGNRLDRIEVEVGRDDRGRLTCELSLSSGRARLDHRLCRVAAKCVRERAEDVRRCIDARKPELLDEVRKSLAEAR